MENNTKRKVREGRLNFIYDGKESQYSLSDLQSILPFHGAMAALLRVILDEVIEKAKESGNPARYLSAIIARRTKFTEIQDGQLEEPTTVNS